MSTSDYIRTMAILAIFLSLLLTLFGDAATWGYTDGENKLTRLTYHWLHANMFHWMANSIVILSLAFRAHLSPWSWLIGFSIAVLYPFTSDIPLVGMSVWMFAMLGIFTTIAHNRMTFFSLNAIAILSGYVANLMADIMQAGTAAHIAWQAHLYAYAAGMFVSLFIHPLFKQRHVQQL